jgi:hypothetical protein
MGKFLWRPDGNRGMSEFENLTTESKYLKAGFFDGKPEAAKAAVAAVKGFSNEVHLN